MSEHRLAEIVIERPRRGMRMSSRKLKGGKKRLCQLTKVASEDGLLSPYLIKPWQKTKYFSDHLGPLRRWLRSQVGQPWNAVYSKLCRRLDTSTLAGQHILSHVWDYVERYVEMIDGVLYCKPEWGGFKPLESHYRDRFYVHPETGLLCVVQKVPRKQKDRKQERDRIVIDRHHQYRQLDEIWYLVTFADFPVNGAETVTDILQGEITWQQAIIFQGDRIYAVSKRQCNKKTLRLIRQQLS
ncbi:hypothetical protein IQ254_10720 [Nodosilinea sp. LEGE 07088]|uniref:hypothetical protein n=1 Tax=Nodosilinea sp. LEGE 07088 TaxID=2777968 RepID=UPI00187E9884|nr:hypothetical protein [Nodosilinea sp. LEGE 07088]